MIMEITSDNLIMYAYQVVGWIPLQEWNKRLEFCKILDKMRDSFVKANGASAYYGSSPHQFAETTCVMTGLIYGDGAPDPWVRDLRQQVSYYIPDSFSAKGKKLINQMKKLALNVPNAFYHACHAVAISHQMVVFRPHGGILEVEEVEYKFVFIPHRQNDDPKIIEGLRYMNADDYYKLDDAAEKEAAR